MNNISLLGPSLEMWGAILTMSCFIYLVTHRKTLGEVTGHYLTLLELNMSLLLILSPAAGLFRALPVPVPKPVFFFLGILLELLRVNQVLLSAANIYHHLPEDRSAALIMRFSAVFTCLCLLLQFFLLHTGRVQIQADGTPAGPAYLVPVAGLLVFLAAGIASLLRNRRKMAPGYFRALLVYLLVPLVTILVFRAFAFADLSFGFSSLTLFGIIFVEQRRILLEREEWLLAERDRLARQTEEMTQMEIQLVLSQIQPEFLKETLTTISGLCDTDTEAARAGVSVFADYLRGNMRSLDRYEPVFFEGHLPHIRNFLYLENLKFGERLQSHFDFETVDFALPSLCVQPLLENAVRYGIAPLGSGTVYLRTRREEGSILVEVEDDGAGFAYDPEKDLKGAYPGIHAVRSRIARQSRGSLEIISSPGRGTLARIRIPT
jgi:signal transduction histidine kinase